MDINKFSETLKAAYDLKASFKCQSCNEIPLEPYFTSLCDHLMCKKCISKTNLCPTCKTQFSQKDIYMNRIMQETISNVNSLISVLDENTNMSTSKNKTDLFDDDSLPDLDISLGGEETNSKKTNSSDNVFKVPDLPKLKETLENQINNTTRSTTTAAAAKTTTTTQSTQKGRRGRKRQQPSTSTDTSVIESGDGLDQSMMNQSQNSSSQQTQSGRAGRRGGKKNDKGETPLHLAVMKKDINAIIQLLNDSSTDVNARDFAGWTPLHEALGENANLEIVRLLVEHGANVTAPGAQRNTPLHEAALNRHYECIKYLLEHIDNASGVFARNEFGITPKDFVKDDAKLARLFDDYAREHNHVTQMMPQQSQADMSMTYGGGNRRSRNSTGVVQKRIILFSTALSDEEKARLNHLAAKLKLQVAKEMNTNVTHVIYNTGKTCNRTLNYMKAILMGIWVVNLKWLEDSVARGALIEENEYEAKGSIRMPQSDGPFKGRLNASCQYPKLFEECNIYLNGEFTAFDRKEMEKLVQLTGANILKREPKLERAAEELLVRSNGDNLPQHLDNEYDSEFACTTFILYETAHVRQIKHSYLMTVRPGWLFSCIDQFKILHPDDPRLK